MKERVISPEQAKYLIQTLERYDSQIKTRVDENRWYMSQKMGYDVGQQVAMIDYLKQKLPPWKEGYAVCFLDNIPDGKHFIKREHNSPCNSCKNLEVYLASQMKKLSEEFSLNQWYLGEKLNRPISELESEADFMKEYGNDWCAGFRACYEERVCPNRGSQCAAYQEKFAKFLSHKTQKVSSKRIA